MLEKYFAKCAREGTSCTGILPDGARIPVPSTGNYGCIIKQGNIRKTIMMEVSNQYIPSNSTIYLPYCPNNINICVQRNSDVLSAPFSGCHMASFTYWGKCLFKHGEFYSFNYGKITSCPCAGNHCSYTCSFRGKKLVAHIAYEADGNYSCEKIWQALKKDCDVHIDFDPMTEIAKTQCNNYGGWIYGLITSLNKYGSIVIGRDDNKVKSIGF